VFPRNALVKARDLHALRVTAQEVVWPNN